MTRISDADVSRYVNSLLAEGARLHALTKVRLQHFHNDAAVSPVLSAPLQRDPGDTYQSVLPFLKWTELKGRMGANHGQVHVTPHADYTRLNANAETLENVLNAWWQLTEENMGERLQDGMADGQIVSYAGIPHWRRGEEVSAALPEHRYLSKEQYGKADGKERENYDPFVTKDDKGEEKGYREVEKSRQERNRKRKALAGSPYVMEIIDCQGFTWRPDRGRQIGSCFYWQRLQMLRYEQQLRDEDDEQRVRLTEDFKVHLYRHAVGEDDDPSSVNRKDATIVVGTYWTRDHWYELATSSQGFNAESPGEVKWTVIKDGAHAWKRPPFSIAQAHRFHVSDVAYAYTPALEAMLRLKPHFDRDQALLKGLVERVALPEIYIKKDPGGMPSVDDKGFLMQFSRDVATAEELPAGWSFELLKIEINPAFVQTVQMTREEYEDAAPATGIVDDVGASTQPWTLRLAIEQGSVLVRGFITNQSYALRDMFRSIAMDMAERPEEEFCAMKILEGGKADPQSIVSIKGSDISDLMVDVHIDNVSAPERITVQQHYLDLYERGVVTLQQFYEEGMAVEDPVKRMRELESEQQAKPYVAKVIAQNMAARYGPRVVMGQDGQLIDINGQAITPEQAFALKGIPPPFPGPGQVPPGGGAPPELAGMIGGMQQMPQMGGQQVPGAIPLPPLGG